tara:strand:- start:1891 stop:2652 length:762 start_codon:yes stop_codon:yes gene_type:complete
MVSNLVIEPKRIGIALSVFNKVTEIKANVEMIRTWECDPFISICCNDPASYEEILKLNVDSVVLGRQLPTSPKTFLRQRAWDCIKTSITNCMSEYIVHWHADAYCLKEQEIIKIVDQMEKERYYVSFRGRGLDYRNGKCQYGDIDDHFLFFNGNNARSNDFFNIPDKELMFFLVNYNVETLLSKRVQELYIRKRTNRYSNFSENRVDGKTLDDFYDDGIQHRAMNSYNYDESRGFLHCETVDIAKQFGVKFDE